MKLAETVMTRSPTRVGRYLAGASVGRGLSAQRGVGQTHVLDDLWELEVYLQQQVLAPPAHHTAKEVNMLQLSHPHFDNVAASEP